MKGLDGWRERVAQQLLVGYRRQGTVQAVKAFRYVS